MDQTVFSQELVKYRIVRRSDYHKIRWKSVSTDNETPKIKEAETRNYKDKPLHLTQNDGNNENISTLFPSVFSKKLSFMTAVDQKSFLMTLEKEIMCGREKISLEDLEAIAASISS
mmetsp:Transcript_33764/g.34400  ORF Transcript_33764/g.34400 Transcript_33764/m.34400 type:complete len:116 (-) Transcript_33764:90-437(-)